MLALRAAPAFVLALAAPGGAASEVRVALSAGAAPGAPREDGATPFDYARQNNEALRGTGARWPLNEARFA